MRINMNDQVRGRWGTESQAIREKRRENRPDGPLFVAIGLAGPSACVAGDGYNRGARWRATGSCLTDEAVARRLLLSADEIGREVVFEWDTPALEHVSGHEPPEPWEFERGDGCLRA